MLDMRLSKKCLCVNMNRTFKNSSTKLDIRMLLSDMMESQECGKSIISASAYLILWIHNIHEYWRGSRQDCCLAEDLHPRQSERSKFIQWKDHHFQVPSLEIVPGENKCCRITGELLETTRVLWALLIISGTLTVDSKFYYRYSFSCIFVDVALPISVYFRRPWRLNYLGKLIDLWLNKASTTIYQVQSEQIDGDDHGEINRLTAELKIEAEVPFQADVEDNALHWVPLQAFSNQLFKAESSLVIADAFKVNFNKNWG